MRKQDITVGSVYTAKVSGKLTTVRVDDIRTSCGYRNRERTVYDCTNLTTGRIVTFKSAAKFLSRVEVEQRPDPTPIRGTNPAITSTPTRSTASTTPSSGDDASYTIEIGECPPAPDEEETPHDTSTDSRAPSSPTKTALPEEDTYPPSEPANAVQSDTGASTAKSEGVPDARVVEKVDCPDCDGYGRLRRNGFPCPRCKTSGKVAAEPVTPTVATEAKGEKAVRKPSALGRRLAAQLEREKEGVAAVPAEVKAPSVERKFDPQRPPHVEVSALAGTGKTTLIIEGLKSVKGLATRITPSAQQEAVWGQLRLGKSDKVRVSAYNTTITDNIKRLLGESGLDRLGVEARGVHGLGYSAVNKAFGRTEPNEYATHDLVAAVVGGEGADYRELRKEPGNAALMSAAVEVTSLCKMTLAEPTPEGIDALLNHHDIEVAGDVRVRLYDVVPQALERSKAPRGRISFDDMLWLPLVLDLPLFKVDVQFIDESQDLNRAQQELIYRAGHRIVFVGDRRQAIYGFAGADSASMTRMGQTLASSPRGMVTMPLTVTRRCSKAVVDLARQIVPEFEAHPDNPAGRVTEALYPIPPRGNNYWTMGQQRQERKWEETYGPLVQAGDLVMCRVNAPAVSQCYRFLKRHIPAQILGRKVGDGLISLVERSKAETVAQLRGWLTDWLERETALENAKKFPSEQRLIALQDKHDCVAVFCEGCNYPHEAVEKIREVFTEKPDRRAVRFSSVHKAKGLESHRAFILMPDGAGMPHPMARTAWQVEQEFNCLYIAQTRAIEELVLVS